MAVINQFDLSGKVAYVTGGAGGIGEQLVKVLLESDTKVAIVDQDGQLAQEIATKLDQQAKGTVIAIEADITDPQQVEEMVKKVVDTFGGLDIAINNVGIVKSIPTSSLSYEEWKKVIDVNLTGVFLCSQVAGRVMIKQPHGVMLNIASISGTVVNTPQPQAAYNASKAGVIQLSKSLAMEWAKYNIRVNTLSPGYIDTAFTVKELAHEWKRHIPLQRLGKTSELQALALYLVSDASSYVTGANYIVDGGYTAV